MIGVIKGTMRQKKEVNGLPLPIASYKANMKAPIRSLKVAITAKQSGTGTPSPDNIRPISGWSECNVVRCGKNLFDKSKERLEFVTTMQTALSNFKQYGKYATGYCNNTSGTMSNNGSYTTSFVPCKPNTTYSLKCYTTSAFTSIHTLDENGNTLSKSSNWTTTYTVTTENNAKYLAFAYSGTEGATVEEASTPSAEYIPYTGNTYTIQLGDTYYGGSLNVTTGVLSVDMYSFVMDGDTNKYTLPATWYNVDVADSNPTFGVYWYFTAQGFNNLPNPKGYTSATDNAKMLCETFRKSDYGLYKQTTPYTMGITGSGSSVYFAVRFSASDLSDTSSASALQNSVMTWFQNNPTTFCYELATPITVQLTPTQVEQLLGMNNVFADTGDVEELKYIDRQVYYGR